MSHNQKAPSFQSPETAAVQAENGGFFRHLGRSWRVQRLGDLLLDHGMITEGQLKSALAEQRQTREKLGQILLRQGAVSAVGLYRKLAGQWCLKASAACITFALHIMAPSAASADNSAGSSTRNAAVTSFNLHAAAVPEELSADIPAPEAYLAALKKDQHSVASSIMPAAGFAQPARHAIAKTGPTASGTLFGKAEKRYNDMSAFANWSALFNRFSKPVETAGPHHIGAVEEWRKGIARFESLSDVEKIHHVNALVNQRPYIDDQKVFGKKGYWEATPVRFLSQGGDCKDYALTKYASLRALGFSDEQMRIAIVKDKIKSVSHAVLIVSLNGKNYVLDNQEKKVKLATEVTRYKPIFSINRNNWWKQAS